MARKRLDDVIVSFTTHAVHQDANDRSAKGETEKQRQLRLTLRREQMAPIAEIARRNLRCLLEFKALQSRRCVVKGPVFLASAGVGVARSGDREILSCDSCFLRPSRRCRSPVARDAAVRLSGS